MGKEEASIIDEPKTFEKVLEVIKSCVTPEQFITASNYAKLFMDRMVQEQFAQIRTINTALQYKREDLAIAPEEEQIHV